MKQKALGQIAYESTSDGGKQNFGPWDKAPDVVKRVHEEMAQAVVRAHMRRHRAALQRRGLALVAVRVGA